MAIKSYCWYGILLEDAICDCFDEGCFSGILQAYDGDF
jgi:hypothetical protein